MLYSLSLSFLGAYICMLKIKMVHHFLLDILLTKYIYNFIGLYKGSIQKIKKRALFHYKKVKRGTSNLTSPMLIVSLQLF